MIGFLDEGVDPDSVPLACVPGVFGPSVPLASVPWVIGPSGSSPVGKVTVCDWSSECFVCGGLCRSLA